MTLGELIGYICTKTGQTDEASAEACRLFLRRRYRMIWDYALWKESLALVSLTVPLSTNILTLPGPADLVVAVRRGSTAIPVLDQTTLMRTDPGAYDGGGSTAGFTMEAPSCLLLPAAETGELFTAASGSAADTQPLLSVSGLGLASGAGGAPAFLRETVALRGTEAVSTAGAFSNITSAVLSTPAVGEVTLRNAAGTVAARLAP